MKQICKEFIYDTLPGVPACHASTVIKCGDRLIAAWFGGAHEKNPDVEIWCSYRDAGVWSAPQMVSVKSDIPCWNPVLFEMEDGLVTLFYKIGHEIEEWKTMVAISRDRGENWSEPVELIPGDTSGGRGPVKNKPLRLSNGRILAPNSVEKNEPVFWRCFIDVYENGEWSQRAIPVMAEEAEANVIQPTLWESSPGHVHALMRSNRGCIFRSDSADYGDTWSPAYPTAMPNNNSGLDCVRLDNGTLALVCNPVEKNWGYRSPLSVFLSTDNGLTFEKALDLETDEGEYSYPAIIAEGDRLYITYTHKRQRIAFCEISL